MFGAGWLNDRIRPWVGRHFEKFVVESIVNGCWDGKRKESINAISKMRVDRCGVLVQLEVNRTDGVVGRETDDGIDGRIRKGSDDVGIRGTHGR
jgi:hypothetical protein